VSGGAYFAEVIMDTDKPLGAAFGTSVVDKYVISKEVVEMVLEIGKDTALFGLGPVNLGPSWFEWTYDQHWCGVLVTAKDESDPVMARVFFWRNGTNALDSYGAYNNPAGETELIDYDGEGSLTESQIRQVLRFASIARNLIEHPVVLEKVKHPESSHLVRENGDLKRKPIPAWVEVHVTKDDARLDRMVGKHAGKRFHHVRPFDRTCLGREQHVSAHWRGDPRLGVMPARPYHVVP
jgi:hypothetical protein